MNSLLKHWVSLLRSAHPSSQCQRQLHLLRRSQHLFCAQGLLLDDLLSELHLVWWHPAQPSPSPRFHDCLYSYDESWYASAHSLEPLGCAILPPSVTAQLGGTPHWPVTLFQDDFRFFHFMHSYLPRKSKSSLFSLSQLNDFGLTFSELADLLESTHTIFIP